ncbi:hypothetical protein ACHAWF_017127 [Thalassiosira exigua]
MTMTDLQCDLSEFLGYPDDICPICLDVMPVLTYRGNERTRSLCCGKFVCPDCLGGVQGHQRTLGKEAMHAAQRSDPAAAARALKSMEMSLSCPLCRTKLPCTPEDSFVATIKNAEKGHAWAQHSVGTKYESGNGTRKNLKEAMKWFKKSTEQGHPWSPSSYGYLLQKGEGGVRRDIAKAKQLYELSIEFGQPQGYEYLANLYENGIGVQKDEKEAVRLHRMAADIGSDVAQCSLGNCYDFGIGVAVNYEEALKWYLASAEQGKNACAMNNAGAKIMQLAQMKYGNDVANMPRDPVPRAYLWFKRASKLGDMDDRSTASQMEANCKDFCIQCKRRALSKSFSRCSKCRLYQYCGKECQLKHWHAGHKRDCVKAD